jgi:hypothetical protein
MFSSTFTRRGISFFLLLILVSGSVSSCNSSEPAQPPTEGEISLTCPPVFEQSIPESDFIPSGTSFYVSANDPKASDLNNGLSSTFEGGTNGPWLTIQHAADTMTPGDAAYLRGGIYYESAITFSNSGLPDAPIALINYPGEEVVIDGSRATDEYPGIAIVEGQDYILIQGLTIRNMPWSGIATDGRGTDTYQGITIRDCILYANGWSGIDLASVDGFVVDNVRSYENKYYGMNISGSDDGAISSANGVVTNSIFYNHTEDEGHGVAINQGHDIVLSDNIACHNKIHGFDVSDMPKFGDLTYNITVERNSSFENGVSGFAINSYSNHVVYRNNAAWYNGAPWANKGTGEGFLCYDGCWHVEWLNNVSAFNTDAGFYVQNLPGYDEISKDTLIVFKNNIAYGNGRIGSEERPGLVVQTREWQIIATNNNWFGAEDDNSLVVGVNLVNDQGDIYSHDEVNSGAFQTGNVSVDPKFTNANLADWRLQADSPMIDSGIDVGLPYCGSAPDMGSVEVCP